MGELVLYIHGKGGGAGECERYRPLFPGREVVGLDWRGSTPWEAGREIRDAAAKLLGDHSGVILIANSIGAYFGLCAGIGDWVRRAYFISPVVDMERLILDMMARARVTEAELEARGVVATDFGEDLSWEYLSYVRAHPVQWTAPTEILYGEGDELTSRATIEAFARTHGARLTVMSGGEHWFHTPAQMEFLDEWIRAGESRKGGRTATERS